MGWTGLGTASLEMVGNVGRRVAGGNLSRAQDSPQSPHGPAVVNMAGVGGRDGAGLAGHSLVENEEWLECELEAEGGHQQNEAVVLEAATALLNGREERFDSGNEGMVLEAEKMPRLPNTPRVGQPSVNTDQDKKRERPKRKPQVGPALQSVSCC